MGTEAGASPSEVTLETRDPTFSPGAPFHRIDEHIGAFDSESCGGRLPGLGDHDGGDAGIGQVGSWCSEQGCSGRADRIGTAALDVRVAPGCLIRGRCVRAVRPVLDRTSTTGHTVPMPLDSGSLKSAIMPPVDANELYLFEHAHVHSAAVAASEIRNLENLLYDDVPEAVCRACPDEHANSMIWLLWHTARSEDVGINLMIDGGRQVFDATWAERMRIQATDIGTGMTFEEVRQISNGADLAAVRDYRRAVGQQTRTVIDGLNFGTLGNAAPPDRLSRVVAEACLHPRAKWVLEFWRPQRLRFFLWLGTGHNYMHLQEASVTRARAGAGLGL